VLSVLTLFFVVLILAYPTERVYATNFTAPGFTEEQVAIGFKNPTTMVVAPDGRLFVLEQESVNGQGYGYVRVIKNDTLLATPFLTLNNVAVDGEHGLVGLAFDPMFASNQYVYVFYTVADVPNVAWHNEVWRYTASGDVALINTGIKVIQFPPITTSNHNGGAMAFGPDGKLYISIGDDNLGSSAVQQIDEFRGRILRFTINADGTFSAPTDNPWYGQATTEINKGSWAMGFRNVHQFSIQPGTGRIYANDVGQDAVEEVDYIQKGKHYGWNWCEGPCSPTNPAYTDPIHSYPHIFTAYSTDGGCAVTGSAFYNPATATFPAQYVGKYFFADYCNNWIKYLNPNNPGEVEIFADHTYQRIVSLGVTANGSMYYLARARSSNTTDGAVFRIDYNANGIPPTFTEHPDSQTVASGQPATFVCVASSTTPITYQWQRRNPGSTTFLNITGATSTTYTTPPTTIEGYNGAGYRCRATNENGNRYSKEGTLTVVYSTPPSVTINYTIDDVTASTTRRTWLLGDTIAFEFSASDAEDGALPDSAFTWSVDMYHEPPVSAIHTHPVLPPTTGASSGSFTIDSVAHDKAHYWYRIDVQAKDSSGLTASASQIIESSLLSTTYNAAVSNAHPTLRWNSIPGASGYEVWLGTTDNPTTRYIVPGGGATTSFVVPSALASNTTYYWYVKVLWSAGGSTTTDTWRFYVNSAPTDAPALHVFNTNQPVLTWNRVSYATGYRVQVATNPTFTGALVYDNANIPANNLSEMVNATPALTDGVLYYWRVAAKKADGTYQYSPAQTFFIKTS